MERINNSFGRLGTCIGIGIAYVECRYEAEKSTVVSSAVKSRGVRYLTPDRTLISGCTESLLSTVKYELRPSLPDDDNVYKHARLH